MFRQLFNFGYKRGKLEALGFCIIYFLIGVTIALSMGALEYFLFSGHKFRHVISGGQFIALVEVWILSCFIINRTGTVSKSAGFNQKKVDKSPSLK